MNKQQRQFASMRPGTQPAVKVLGPSYNDLAFALRVFKQSVKDSNKLEELRERRYYEKRSVKRRKKLDNAIFSEEQARKEFY